MPFTIPSTKARISFTTEFILDGVNQLTASNVMDFVCPYAGYLVASSIMMESSRTAGSLEVTLHKNGGVVTEGLDLLIDDNPTQKSYEVITYGTLGFDVAAGDRIGFLVTTTTFTPLSNRGFLTLVVELT